jgi:hypothetical protein
MSNKSSLYSYTQNDESGSNAAIFGPAPGGSNRDLLNAITLVDAKECPLMAMIPKAGGVTNLNFEWPVDKELAAEDNAAIDGRDLQHGFTSVNTDGDNESDFGHVLDEYAIMNNRVQWFRRAALVSKLTESATNLAGVANQRAYAVRKQLLALKRDMEIRLCADHIPKTGATKNGWYNAGAVTGSSTVGNKTASLGAFIDDHDTAGIVPTGYTVPAASVFDSDATDNDAATVTNSSDAAHVLTTTSTITEDEVNGVLQSIYEQTGKINTKTLLCGPNFKKRFKDFTAVTVGSSSGGATVARSYNAPLADKKVISTVDVYEGDFGTLQLVPTLWNAFNFPVSSEGEAAGNKAVSWSGSGATGAGANPNLSYGYVLDMDLLELRFHQLPQVQPLPNQGAGERFAVDAIAGLCVKNPLGLGAFKLIK